MMNVAGKSVDEATAGEGMLRDRPKSAFSSTKRLFCLRHVALAAPRTPFRDRGSNRFTRQGAKTGGKARPRTIPEEIDL